MRGHPVPGPQRGRGVPLKAYQHSCMCCFSVSHFDPGLPSILCVSEIKSDVLPALQQNDQKMDGSPFVMGCLASRPTSQVFSVNKTHFIVLPFYAFEDVGNSMKAIQFFGITALASSSVPCVLCFSVCFS